MGALQTIPEQIIVWGYSTSGQDYHAVVISPMGSLAQLRNVSGNKASVSSSPGPCRMSKRKGGTSNFKSANPKRNHEWQFNPRVILKGISTWYAESSEISDPSQYSSAFWYLNHFFLKCLQGKPQGYSQIDLDNTLSHSLVRTAH